MGNINEDLQEILKEIQVPEEEIENAIEKHSDVRIIIADELGGRTLITGSYKRKTAVKPLNDVDVFLWLPKDMAGVETLTDLKNNIDPEKLLQKVKRKLKNLDIDHDIIRVQGHSLGIRYEGAEFGIDLIPAFSAKDPNEETNFDRKFWIPEKETKKWISSNPETQRKLTSQANQSSNNKLVPLVKILKHWKNQESSKTLKSYHIEALCIYLAKENPSIFEKGKGYFTVLLEAVTAINKILESGKNIGSVLNMKNPAEYLTEDESRNQKCIRKMKRFSNDLNKIKTLIDKGEYEKGREVLYGVLPISKVQRSQKSYSTRIPPEQSKTRFG